MKSLFKFLFAAVVAAGLFFPFEVSCPTVDPKRLKEIQEKVDNILREKHKLQKLVTKLAKPNIQHVFIVEEKTKAYLDFEKALREVLEVKPLYCEPHDKRIPARELNKVTARTSLIFDSNPDRIHHALESHLCARMHKPFTRESVQSAYGQLDQIKLNEFLALPKHEKTILYFLKHHGVKALAFGFYRVVTKGATDRRLSSAVKFTQPRGQTDTLRRLVNGVTPEFIKFFHWAKEVGFKIYIVTHSDFRMARSAPNPEEILAGPSLVSFVTANNGIYVDGVIGHYPPLYSAEEYHEMNPAAAPGEKMPDDLTYHLMQVQKLARAERDEIVLFEDFKEHAQRAVDDGWLALHVENSRWDPQGFQLQKLAPLLARVPRVPGPPPPPLPPPPLPPRRKHSL